ncbi:MAG: phosphotriesterase [Dehalococcoidia bacterium]
MAIIQTARGPIPASELGFTISHEHVLTSQGQDWKHYPWMFDKEATRRVAVQSLLEAQAAGVTAFIDLTTPDLGRDIEFFKSVAIEAAYHIVCATGIWRDVPRSFAVRDIDQSADIFVREIEVGIEDSGVKAGVIKVANDENELTPAHVNVLRAAARASNRTGCPISTHHWAVGEQGREQIRIFKEEGVQMDRVCIGHTADTTNIEYIEWLFQQGVYVSMDRYGPSSRTVGWEQRNESVKELIRRGWAGKMMLGHDGHATFPFRKQGETREVKPDNSLVFVKNVAIPALLKDGVPQDTIDTMMVDVPRRFLTGED